MTDRYTRAVLTVIALCLVWLCVASAPSLIPTVSAQPAQKATEVVIVGWRDTSGETWSLPTLVRLPNQGGGELSSEAAKRIDALRRQGLRLPTDTN